MEGWRICTAILLLFIVHHSAAQLLSFVGVSKIIVKTPFLFFLIHGTKYSIQIVLYVHFKKCDTARCAGYENDGFLPYYASISASNLMSCMFVIFLQGDSDVHQITLSIEGRNAVIEKVSNSGPTCKGFVLFSLITTVCMLLRI